jgi:hypothetical protein
LPPLSQGPPARPRCARAAASDVALSVVRRAQAAAVSAVVNMAFGEPTRCRTEACMALVKALKSPLPSQRLASAQAMQRILAQPAARGELYAMQVAPALVAVCATGMRRRNLMMQLKFAG